MSEFPIFTLSEANYLLAEVIAITEEATVQLAELQAMWGQLPFKKYDATQGATAEDLIRAEWARRIAGIGVQPKGFFVVDFQSPDPDTLYCWSYGETMVSHEHKVWETFVDRRAIRDVRQFEAGSSPSHNDDNAPRAREDETALDD